MKKNLRFYLALFFARLVIIGCKLMKGNATTSPGRWAIRICPDFIGRIGKPAKIICVTGTNGKTTVSNMLIDSLAKCGYKTLNNHLGGNIHYGVASTLIQGSDFFGNTKYDYAVLEVDERSSIRIYPYLTPTILVVTNLFRDSIYRNAHTEYILDIIKRDLPKETKLVLNADDLISSRVGEKGNDKVYFSIDRLDTDKDHLDSNIVDIRTCPKCNSELVYDYVRYHHIGKAHCPKCGFKSPVADYLVTNIDYDKMIIDVKIKGTSYSFKIINNNIINIYNTVSAIAALHEFGISIEKIQEVFGTFEIVKSRFEADSYHGIEIISQVAKGLNPVATSRAFDYVKNESGNKVVFLNLDDYYVEKKGESENTTWLYDTDFELLEDESIKKIIIGGVRAKDYLMRMMIAGINPDRIAIERHYEDEIKHLDLDGVTKIFILHDIYNKFIADHLTKEIKAKIDKEGR